MEGSVRPNILLIVADDMGYSDIGSYGGEIPTPNLDRLADEGMSFTRFYAAPTCSPARAMLMTGVDSHVAGLGNMAETVADNQMGLPGYEGHLRAELPTIAERLTETDYHTYMAGKWHLGLKRDQSAHARGFERSFALLYGAASHYDDGLGPDSHRPYALYREDGNLVDELPAGFFSTSFYTDRMIDYIDSNLADGRPFFGYVAYTAPHWPLQLPGSFQNSSEGRYDRGYDVVRAERFKRMQQLGLVPAETALPERPADVAAWAELTEQARHTHAREMEIYAGMVEHLDHNIGRLLEHLRTRGELENTVIVFLSDNGADAWGHGYGPPPIAEYAASFDNSPENIGRPGSFTLYGRQWAHVSNTPLRGYKGSTTEGGIRVPLIIAAQTIPKRDLGSRHHSPVAITDLSATLLDFAGITDSVAGTGSLSGQSLRPVLDGESSMIRGEKAAIGMEIWGRRAAIRGAMKIMSFASPTGPDEWEMYDLSSDMAEQKDIRVAQQDAYGSMLEAWQAYAEKNNVVLPDGPMKIRPPGPAPLE